MALVNLSPLLAVYSLSQDGGAPIPPEQWSLILVLGIAAVAVWVALLAYAAISARRSSTAIEV
jgi:hypothetical protein